MVSSPPITRGFLFADLRGYTAFVERHGNAAGAALLERYRALVRGEIDRFAGAEIRTEGDSVYVVFPSASLAVSCGMAIAEAVAAESRRGITPPIVVGIGINAGETVDAPGGPVGSAVNLAARVASVARGGEVLVTDTVRHLVQGNAQIRFSARGRPRLKGIGERVPLSAAVAVSGTPALQDARRPTRLLAIPAVIALATLGVLIVTNVLTGPRPTSNPSAAVSPVASAGPIDAPTPDPADVQRPIPLASGRYRLTLFRPRLEFTIPENGWTLAAQSTDVFEIGRYAASIVPDAYISGQQVQVVYDFPCPTAPTRTLEERPRALIEWLQGNAHISTSNPQPLSFAGFTGLELDIEYLTGPGEECAPFESEEERTRLHLFPVGQVTFKLDPGERARVISVDVEGRPLTLLIGTYNPDHYDDFHEIAQPIVESITVIP